MKRFSLAVLWVLVAMLVCGCGLTSRQRAQLKENLRQEILAELRSQQDEQEAAAAPRAKVRPRPAPSREDSSQQFVARPKSGPSTEMPGRQEAAR